MTNDPLNQPIKELEQYVKELSDTLSCYKDKVDTILAEQDNERSHRMSYLTWTVVSPLGVVFIPPIIIIIFQTIIYNLGKPFGDFSLGFLTLGTSWVLPFAIFVFTLYIALNNKLYTFIQENCDMKLIKLLEISINGQARRIKAEQDEYKAEQARKEAEYKAEQARRDQEIKDLIKQLEDIKLSQVRLETKIDK